MSSYLVTILHRGGLPNLLQYYIGGVLKVYYNITVLKGKVTISYLLMWIYDCKCRKYTFFGGGVLFQIITILHSGGCQNLLQYFIGGGVFPNYYNITMGGGVSRDPKFVLRNIWTAPYGSAPENSRSLMSHWCGQCWNLS